MCAKEAATYNVGNGMDPDNKVEPLVSTLQQEQAKSHVEDALEKGAKKLYQTDLFLWQTPFTQW